MIANHGGFTWEVTAVPAREVTEGTLVCLLVDSVRAALAAGDPALIDWDEVAGNQIKVRSIRQSEDEPDWLQMEEFDRVIFVHRYAHMAVWERRH